MLEVLTGSQLYSTFALGGLLAMAGIGGLLGRALRVKASAKSALVGAALCLPAAAAAWALDLGDVAVRPLLLLAGVLSLMAAARSTWAAAACRGAAKAAAKPVAQSAVLLAAGLALLVAQSYAIDDGLGRELALSDAAMEELGVPDIKVDPAHAGRTDAGQRVTVWVPATTESMTHSPARETELLRRWDLEKKVIQTGPADPTYNCHGWVFTGGKYWVRGGAVDAILKENKYDTVSVPEPGDLAVFRERNGEVTHSAVVRAVTDDGMILLESKWGQMGRYLHTATDHSYAEHDCTYYRSPREGHVLTGLEEEDEEK